LGIEKRRHKRVLKRLHVRYGEGDLAKTSILGDISAGGCFIISNTLPTLGARIQVQVFVDQKRSIHFEAVVQRHKQVPPNMRSVDKSGFGVRFLLPEELIGELVPQESGKGKFSIRYPTPADLQKAYAAELKHGGIFIRTEQKLARDAAVAVAIQVGTQSFEVQGTVIQVFDGSAPGGVKGLAVRIADPASLAKSLEPLLK
jgi:Tfp pilus assembly protein PilZ